MKRELLLISTSWRHTTFNQPSGRLLVFDIHKREVVRECEIVEPPYREFDPNPRGGFRGLKGISINADSIAIANASTIFLYDYLWRPIKYLWHPSCAGIHDIYLQKNHIWATSSRNDLLMLLDFNGNIVKYIDVRNIPIIRDLEHNQIKPFLSDKQIISGSINFRDPRTHDHAITDLLHINSLSILNTGDILVSCGLLRKIDSQTLHHLNHLLKQSIFSKYFSRCYKFYRNLLKMNKLDTLNDKNISTESSKSLILRISNNGKVMNCLVQNDCSVPSHSIRILNNGSAIYLNSSSGELIQFDPEKNKITLKTKIGEQFLRGACQLNNESVFLGDNNELIHFDLAKNQIVSTTVISINRNEAIFDVDVLPDHFDLPPESFIKLHEQLLPVNQK